MIDLEKRSEVWARAINILDETEPVVRDLIERELASIAGISGTRYGDAMRATDALMKQIRRVRTDAIKKAFRFIRDSAS